MREFFLEGKLNLVIEDNVLSDIYAFSPEKYKYENGGVLLGKYDNKVGKYVITNISTTNNNDRKGKFYFIRDKKSAQKIINRYWIESHGEINYLGEWHTHDEEYPKPSFIDKRLVKQMIRNKNEEIDSVFMIILGKNKRMYLCTIDKSKNIHKLKEE